MTDYSKVKVGDKVWYTDVNRKLLQHAVVTKVGTKLITVGPYSRVFRKDTGLTNDDYQHQRLIVDFDAYHEQQKANSQMQALYRRMSSNPAEGVSAEDITAAAKLLKINI
jgi:hypothetical protein